MSALATPPVPGLVSDIPVKPVAAVTDAVLGKMPESTGWTIERTKNVAVSVYAYGLLGFGVLFPFVLAAWKLLFNPVTG
jgi:hypothetical protein